MIIIFKTIFAYISLMFIGQIIIGFLLSGLYVPKRIESDIDVINEMQDKYEYRNHLFNFITIIVLIIYLYALNYYWNIYLLVSGLILIISKIPDLIFQIKAGKKINVRDLPKNPINYFCVFLDWAVIPLIWYSFYIMKN